MTLKEIKRQDFVDNSIYELIQRISPSGKKIIWDIEIIGDIRDKIEHWLVDRYNFTDSNTFYP